METAGQTTPTNSAAPAAPPAPAPKPLGKTTTNDTEWESAKDTGRKAAAEAPVVPIEGIVAPTVDGAEAEPGTEPTGEQPGDPAADPAKPGEEPAPAAAAPERDVTTERVPSKEWREFLAREADFKRRSTARISKLEAREKAIGDREKEAEGKLKEAEGKVSQTLERAKLVAAVESADPWESWQAFATAKGWDEAKSREVLGVAFRRYANGGAATLEDRVAAAEREARTAADTATERVRKEFEAKQAEEAEKKKAETAAADEQERVKRAETTGKADIVKNFTAAIEAGRHPFLKGYPAEHVANVAWKRMLDHYNQSGGEILELDTVLSDLNTGIKQEYERLSALDPERGRSGAQQRSETDTGKGDPARANPVTQRANGSPPRTPTTVTTRLAADRSEATPSKANDAEAWEAAKRAARLKARES